LAPAGACACIRRVSGAAGESSPVVERVASGLVVCLIAGLLSFAATWLVRRHAPRLGLVQAPNARSSHSVPTPGGGGLGIVLGGAVASLYAVPSAPVPVLTALVASLVLAAVGFRDDRAPLHPGLRLLAQAALWLLAVLATGALTPLAAGAGIPAPLLLAGLALVGVYWINLFNFMDGIDGLAGSQAVFMLLGAAALALLGGAIGPDAPLLWWLAGIAAATLGFLVLNWPPATIFMGDVGSTWLGFVLAVLALLTMSWGWLSLWQWLILGAAFVTDASVTLARRLLRGERVLEAHRRHAYQALARRWRSHRRVTLLFIGIDLAWLLPLAVWAAGAGWVAAALAYAPLVALALAAGAGAPEQAERAR